MIYQLITALSKEVEMSAAEIADTIWLALQMQEFPSESVSSDLPLRTEDEREIKKPENQLDQLEKTPNKSLKEPKAGIYPRNEQQTSKSSNLSFKVPDAPSLREPLTLARALKPLMRRVPSEREFVLDEAATIQRIVDEGLWIPVLKSTVEPWLDLELVVDESISMQIWRHTIRDWERMLKNYGIFRDVRVWGLITDEKEQVQIRRGIGAMAKNQTPRSPKELIDPTGRRLVLVVSDCVSSVWRNGELTPVLELWAKQGSMAIVQMLPKWLWKRTALGRASEVRLRGLTPGVFNQKLIAKEVSLWDELEEETGVKVPVFTLELDKVATWAQMLSGKGSIWTLGYVFKLDAPVKKERELFNLNHSELNAEQRVQAFRVTASPMARKLAGLLASAPVISLPIVRLIREAMLKESQQVHVAEVFLGGLLKPLSEINADTNPDYVQYEFMDGVRELLVDSVPSEYVLNVVDEVSEYVARMVGLSLEDFASVLKNPQEVRDSEIVEGFGYFATVTAQVLRRLGGDYTKIAEELESNNFVKTSENQVSKNLLREDLEKVLDSLSPRERDVLRLRYGLDDGRMKTLEEIGQIFNVTRERIRQIESKALRKLRDPNRTSVLKVDLWRNLQSKAEDRQYYINFSEVRGVEIIKELKRTITRLSPESPTCQLFTGHIGCGKSTELLRLKAELQADGFHVVYFQSSQSLDLDDIDITDILLAITREVAQSLESAGIQLKPRYFQNLFTEVAEFLQTPLDIGSKAVSVGSIGKITTKTKESPKLRRQLKQYLEPRTNGILEAINQELLKPAQKRLKAQGKKGLVVIVDDLNRITNLLKPNGQYQAEYLFVDRGELLQLNCHVVYTIPIFLTFSNALEKLTNRFGIAPKVLPMVAIKQRNGTDYQVGIQLLQQMVMTRAFPGVTWEESQNLITKIFDSPETLERLCKVSGGHLRTLLMLLSNCLQMEDTPISRKCVETVIKKNYNQLSLAITPDEWELLKEVQKTKACNGEERYDVLIHSMFVFEYQDEDGSWFDINPILIESKNLSYIQHSSA